MDDRVLLKVYYFGQILLQTSEGVKFICENLLDVVIPFTISFEEIKCVICEKLDFEMSKKISYILYRYPIPVFGRFIQFQVKYMTDEASLQEMFSMYIESRAQISFIELYVEFEQSETGRNIIREDYDSDSEEEFESNYEVVGPDSDEYDGDDLMAPNVMDVANALANKEPFEEPSFMRVLDLDAMHVPEFPEYMSVETPIVADGEFVVGMEFSFREAVKEVSMISRKHCWVIRRYNGSHTCTRATISQDHSKLDSITIAEAIKPLVEADPSLKATFYRLNKLFTRKRDEAEARINAGHIFSELVTSACKPTSIRKYPAYVHDVYKMDQVRRVYRARFRPLRNPTTWPAYNGPRFVPNPFLRCITKGRPRMTRFLNEIDT
ncbi:hypothetical protein Ahy_A03g015342 [Arachis hypogaea]|uniref:Transposase MuDR plant domain-containing protein n=1 Tax=Arachis hypogaea TaxID=3818 RepID=A0A445E057_ARAHY|nr:hypothetical protein Ahy_A03g015342 [Arachis hypogaea]